MAIRQSSTTNRHRHHPGTPKGDGQAGPSPSQLRSQNLARAQAALANALVETKGVAAGEAQHIANVMLSNPNVQIGANGSVYYKGKQYDATAFVNTPFSDLVRGVTAQRQNQAAIQGEPGYMQDLANLTLQRELSTAGLGDQRTRAIIDFGDPGFAGSDTTVAGEARVNPFSVIAGLARQRQQAALATANQTNRYGTYQGGGLASGQAENSRLDAARTSEAVRSLTDLLSGITNQQAQAGQIYATGQAQAQQDAYQRLLQAGGIHAAGFVPTWSTGNYHYYHPPRATHVGTGGLGAPPPPPPPPRTRGGVLA